MAEPSYSYSLCVLFDGKFVLKQTILIICSLDIGLLLNFDKGFKERLKVSPRGIKQALRLIVEYHKTV